MNKSFCILIGLIVSILSQYGAFAEITESRAKTIYMIDNDSDSLLSKLKMKNSGRRLDESMLKEVTSIFGEQEFYSPFYQGGGITSKDSSNEPNSFIIDRTLIVGLEPQNSGPRVGLKVGTSGNLRILEKSGDDKRYSDFFSGKLNKVENIDVDLVLTPVGISSNGDPITIECNGFKYSRTESPLYVYCGFYSLNGKITAYDGNKVHLNSIEKGFRFNSQRASGH